jgi:hypothetical protein
MVCFQAPSGPSRSKIHHRDEVSIRKTYTDFHLRLYLRPNHSFCALGFRAGVGYVVALAVETDNKHGSSVAIADGLVRCQNRRFSALGSSVADALAKTTAAELVGAAKKFDGIVGIVRSESRFHGAVMLIAKR